MARRVPITVLVPAALRARLQKRARQEDTSLSRLAERVLADHVGLRANPDGRTTPTPGGNHDRDDDATE